MSDCKPGEEARSMSDCKPGEEARSLSECKPGDTLLLCSCPIEALQPETPAPAAPNEDVKQPDNVCLGSPHPVR